MRTKKEDKYQIERNIICDKIINILELSYDNTFLLCELDSNIEKQHKLLSLKDEIKLYFECSTISTFKPNFYCKRPYLNLIRSILRKQKYTIEGKDILMKQENGLYIKTMKYYILNKIE
jgi:hypothetical protein